VLLCFGFGCESGVCGFDGSLVGGGSRLGGELSFPFRLLARLRLLDRAHVGSDAALRPHLSLALHFGSLQCKPCGVAVGFGTRGSLCGARALGGFTCARGDEGSALGIRGGLEIQPTVFLRLDRIAWERRVGLRISPWGCVRCRFRLAGMQRALQFLLPPDQLCTLDVPEQLAQSDLRIDGDSGSRRRLIIRRLPGRTGGRSESAAPLALSAQTCPGLLVTSEIAVYRVAALHQNTTYAGVRQGGALKSDGGTGITGAIDRGAERRHESARFAVAVAWK
jgi:hypothetical protein